MIIRIECGWHPARLMNRTLGCVVACWKLNLVAESLARRSNGLSHAARTAGLCMGRGSRMNQRVNSAANVVESRVMTPHKNSAAQARCTCPNPRGHCGHWDTLRASLRTLRASRRSSWRRCLGRDRNDCVRRGLRRFDGVRADDLRRFFWSHWSRAGWRCRCGRENSMAATGRIVRAFRVSCKYCRTKR